jgi:hypothetical protein
VVLWRISSPLHAGASEFEWSDSWVTDRTGNMGDSPTNSLNIILVYRHRHKLKNDLARRSPSSLIAIRASAKIRLHCDVVVVWFYLSVQQSSKMWECGNREAISKDGGKDGKPAFGFPGFPRAVISTSRSVSVRWSRFGCWCVPGTTMALLFPGGDRPETISKRCAGQGGSISAVAHPFPV